MINYNPSMDGNYIHHKEWDEITHPFKTSDDI